MKYPGKKCVDKIDMSFVLMPIVPENRITLHSADIICEKALRSLNDISEKHGFRVHKITSKASHHEFKDKHR